MGRNGHRSSACKYQERQNRIHPRMSDSHLFPYLFSTVHASHTPFIEHVPYTFCVRQPNWCSSWFRRFISFVVCVSLTPTHTHSQLCVVLCARSNGVTPMHTLCVILSLSLSLSFQRETGERENHTQSVGSYKFMSSTMPCGAWF